MPLESFFFLKTHLTGMGRTPGGVGSTVQVLLAPSDAISSSMACCHIGASLPASASVTVSGSPVTESIAALAGTLLDCSQLPALVRTRSG